MGGPRTREELDAVVLFNTAFFGTLAWLTGAATVAESDGWWYELGQFALAITGIVFVWVAWWFDSHHHTRQALHLAGAALATLSVWVTSVHEVLL
jgi:hypothetical protein